MTNLVKFSITLSLVFLIDNVHADREAFESTYAPLAPEKLLFKMQVFMMVMEESSLKQTFLLIMVR